MLGRIVDEAARRFGDRTVVDAPDGLLTYTELAEASTRAARSLVESGVRPGDVVALVLPSGCDWLVAAVATSRCGAAFAGISPVLSIDERAALVRLVRPRVVLATPELVDGLPLRSNVMVVEAGTRMGAVGIGAAGIGAVGTARRDALHDASAHAPAAPPTRESEPGHLDAAEDYGRPAVICFTSGTTGMPKAAMYTGHQLRAIQRIDLGEDFEQVWDGGAPMLASTQFAHVGMATKFPWYLRLGVTLCVMARWRADEALRLVAEHHMPTIGAIAPQLALMLRSPLLDELDLGSVRMVIAGGAASPPDLVRAVRQRFGAGYSIRYSSTESGGVGLATDPGTDDETEWSTVGRPRAGVEVRIADDDDRPLADGEVGELQIRSDATMREYWNDPAATVRALSADRWLRTGDLARMDANGRVVLVGRSSDMYIRGGYNVFPSEVESVLGRHPGVADVVIVPVADDVMGEIGVALVVPGTTDPPSLDELREFGSEHLARYKLPERLQVIEAVPLTPAQKIDRSAAKRLLA